MEKPRRPIDLPLLKIRLPIGGIISIVHRVTGVLLVLVLPAATYLLDKSLQNQAGFDWVSKILNGTLIKSATLVVIALFIQHLLSGLRHLLLDFHIGIEKNPARVSAWAVPWVVSVDYHSIRFGVISMTQVNKTGAAHAGLIEWLIQRLTAVYMALFLIFIFTQFSAHSFSSYEQWSRCFEGSLVRWAWMLFYISALWHSWIGLRSVFLDYIKPFWLRLSLTLATAVALFVQVMWLIDILYIRTAGGGI